jgi:transposase
MKKFLTAEKRTDLKTAHQTERDRKKGDRIKVVLLSDQGERVGQISKFLLIDEQTVRNHLKDYFDNDKLDGSSGGSKGKLSAEQALEFSAILVDRDVPTAQVAVQIAKRVFGVEFSISGMTSWLKRYFFLSKKVNPYLPRPTHWHNQNS